MSEKELHLAICKYLKMQYPTILFSSEQSGLRVSINQAKHLKATRSCSGLPDIMILEPRKSYYGMFLEIKKDGTNVYKKNGDLRSDSHLEQQEEILHQLKQKGYFAEFIVGFDQAKAVIDYYFNKT